MERQFTATAYVIDKQKTLLIFHKKLQKWLPPGGHLDSNETPAEGARREVCEETGLDIEFIKQENIWINSENSNSFERPYLCLLEEIPMHGTKPAHQHIDFIYIATPVGGTESHNPHEIEDMRWFSLEEVEKLKVGIEIFADTQQTIRQILTHQ